MKGLTSRGEPRRCRRPARHLQQLGICVAAVITVLAWTQTAGAGKEHCRDISFDGVAGLGSQDVVSFTVLACDGSTIHESCPIQVQSSEDSVDFLKRLPGSWGEPDFSSCPTPDPNNLPKKVCVNSNNGTSCNPSTGEGCRSCKLKLKLKQKSDGTYKKKNVQLCCYEQADCKKKLGKTDLTSIPVTLQAEKNFSEVCPPDAEACAEAPSNCVINLDPMGMQQFPGSGAKICRATIGGEIARLTNSVITEMAKCHSERLAGTLPASTNCNDPATDAGGGVGSAETRLRSKIAPCADVGSPWRMGYRTCHTPCDTIDILTCTAGTNLGAPCATDRDCDSAPGALDGACGDWDQVANCLICEAETAAAQTVTDKFGTPATSISPAAAQCQNAIGKAFSGLVKTQLSETASCQKKRDSAKVVLPASAPACKDADLRGKRAKAELRAGSTISKSCNDSVVSELDAICSGATTVTAVGACVVTNGRQINDAVSAISFPETRTAPPGGCPGTAVLELTAGSGQSCTRNTDCIPGVCVGGICTTPTDIDLGWTGLGHDQDVSDKTRLALTLGCTATEAPCGTCSVTGVKATGGNCRCSNDPTLACTQPFASDPACGGNACECYIGEPLPVSAGSASVCIVNRLTTAPSGTVDVDSGAADVTLRVSAQVHLAVSAATPCPVCLGDSVPGDGSADGTCSGGARSGMACDAGRAHPTFGPVSLDCPPSSASNVSGPGLVANVDLTTGSTALFPTLPCSLSGQVCPCGLCSGDSTIACSTNTDCAPAGAGSCSGGAQGAPNACSDLNCSPTTGNEGVCAAGPIDTYCDGFLTRSGQGIVPCASQADCNASASTCPGGFCGNCALSRQRECFPDLVTASGLATPGNPVVVSALCVPPTASSAVNTALGLPGPARVVLQATPTLFCATNPTLRYSPDVGGCP